MTVAARRGGCVAESARAFRALSRHDTWRLTAASFERIA